MSPYLGRETVTLIRRVVTGTDRYGNDVTTDTEDTVTGCSVQPVSSTEELGTGDRVTSRWRLFAPPGTALAAVDAVRVDGEVYEIDGDPEPWKDWQSRPHHIEAFLRKARG